MGATGMKATKAQDVLVVLRPLLRPLGFLLWLVLDLVFLLPLLLIRPFRERYFVFFFRVAMFAFPDCFAKARGKALEALKGIESHDSRLRKCGALKLLEVGAGTGPNFEYITRPIKYTNVDPNKVFGPVFREQLEKHPQIELERWVHGYGEDMSEIPSGEFDVVLLTYAFCSVQDRLKVLREARRVLVKGGHLVFLEHVTFPKGTWQRILQNLLAPLMKVANCNCHINRDIPEDDMYAAGFSTVKVNYIRVSLPLALSRHAYGVAVA